MNIVDKGNTCPTISNLLEKGLLYAYMKENEKSKPRKKVRKENETISLDSTLMVLMLSYWESSFGQCRLLCKRSAWTMSAQVVWADEVLSN